MYVLSLLIMALVICDLFIAVEIFEYWTGTELPSVLGRNCEESEHYELFQICRITSHHSFHEKIFSRYTKEKDILEVVRSGYRKGIQRRLGWTYYNFILGSPVYRRAGVYGILVKEILQLPNWIHWLEIAFQTCRFRLNLLNWNEGTHGWVPLTLDRDWKPKSYIENKKGFQRLLCQSFSRWWFQIFFIFTPTWGDDPTRRIFFNWVETTN